jgi:anti-sigma factor (TIGR02949 family)
MVGVFVPIPTNTVEIDCREVWKELSNYMEGDVSSELRERIAIHLQTCKHCTAIHDGTRNVVRLLGDEKAIELPQGFRERLFDRLMRDSRQG